MIPTDIQLASLCQATYNPAATWANQWAVQGVYLYHTVVDEYDVIAFRGSSTAQDWQRDFVGYPVNFPYIGWCHGGFGWHLQEVYETILPALQHRIIVTGHSLGAARASLFGALLSVLAPGWLISRVVFGEPLPGYQQHVDLLQSSGASLRSYCNRDDPVTRVPHLFHYVRASPLIQLDAAPEAGNTSIFRDHSMTLYLAGIETYLHQEA